jgi:hypothetical protein
MLSRNRRILLLALITMIAASTVDVAFAQTLFGPGPTTTPVASPTPSSPVPSATAGPTRLRLVQQDSKSTLVAPSQAVATQVSPTPSGTSAPGTSPSGTADKPAPSTFTPVPPATTTPPSPPTANPPGGPSFSPPGSELRPVVPPPRMSPPQFPPSGNDPTVPGPAIRELLGQGDQKKPDSTGSEGVPVVRLRGRIAVRNKPVVALVQFEDRTFSVREGAEFSVMFDGTLTPLRVVKLTATECVIEAVNRRTTINLN